jgi:hypothetical protein
MEASIEGERFGMQVILDQMASAVRPALRKYLEAESALTTALHSGDAAAIATARENVQLAGRQAVDVLHHFSDFVLKEPCAAFAFAKIDDVRTAVASKCVYGRGGSYIDDVRLLRDVADAFKHHKPDRASATVAISTDVTPVGTGYAMMRWGEGKYGGAEQIVITTRDGGKRALSSVLQNVFDAWMTLLGQPLPPISQY